MSHHHHHKHHEHGHHHSRHHQNEEEIRRPGIVYYGEPAAQGADLYAVDYERAMKEQKHHKQMEHVAEVGAVAAGAFAMVRYLFESLISIFNPYTDLNLF